MIDCTLFLEIFLKANGSYLESDRVNTVNSELVIFKIIAYGSALIKVDPNRMVVELVPVA